MYHDGSRQRFADPAAVWRALLNHPKFDFSAMILPANQGQEPERTIALDALAEIFAVQRWTRRRDKGCSSGSCWILSGSSTSTWSR
jgi:hypothetical protein